MCLYHPILCLIFVLFFILLYYIVGKNISKTNLSNNQLLFVLSQQELFSVDANTDIDILAGISCPSFFYSYLAISCQSEQGSTLALLTFGANLLCSQALENIDHRHDKQTF